MAEGKKVKIETYNAEEWEEYSHKKIPEYFHEFGIEQNRYNRIVANRLRKVEAENRELHLQMQEQADYYMKHIEDTEELVRELYSQIDVLRKEIDRLKLTAKLNTNSIDRIMKKMPGALDIDVD